MIADEITGSKSPFDLSCIQLQTIMKRSIENSLLNSNGTKSWGVSNQLFPYESTFFTTQAQSAVF